MIRIVLADDHPIVLDGLRNLIGAENDFELVGEAASGLAALKIIREKQPDVAVLDISMPEINGIVLSRRLAGEMPTLRVLVLTLHEDRAYEPGTRSWSARLYSKALGRGKSRAGHSCGHGRRTLRRPSDRRPRL